MPNPLEPIKSSPLAAPPPPPPQPSPEFLPPSSFDPTNWPTWSSLESSTQALTTNPPPPTYHTNKTTANATTANNRPPPTTTHPTTPQRKRRPSKPAEGQLQTDPATLLGERFGIEDVLEAVRGKVEVERVVGRLLEWRREWQSGGMKGAAGGREVKGWGSGGGECGEGDEAVLGKRVFQFEGTV